MKSFIARGSTGLPYIFSALLVISSLPLFSLAEEIENNDNEDDTFFKSDSRVSKDSSCQPEITRICRKTVDTTQKLPDLMALECVLNQKVSSKNDSALKGSIWFKRLTFLLFLITERGD